MKNRIVLFLATLIASGSVVALGLPTVVAAAELSQAECVLHSGVCQTSCYTAEAGGNQKVAGYCQASKPGGERPFCCVPLDVDMNAPKPSYTDVQCADHFGTCVAKCKSTEASVGTCTKGGKTLNCCQSLKQMETDSKYMGVNECKTQGGSCVSNSCDKSNKDCIDIGTCYQPQLQAEKVGFCVKFVGETAMAAASSTAKTTTGDTTQTTQEQAPKAVAGGIPQLACESSGNCTVQDIVTKGISFAAFIMGLSGAMFLLVFVYGGAMYILSFGKSAWVDKGKKAMIQACIGIVLVMGAWTIVFYVSKSLGYKAPSVSTSSSSEKGGSKGICGKAAGTEGRTCMDVNGAGKGKDCLKSYCSGAANIQCCK